MFFAFIKKLDIIIPQHLSLLHPPLVIPAKAGIILLNFEQHGNTGMPDFTGMTGIFSTAITNVISIYEFIDLHSPIIPFYLFLKTLR
jgi:hypothetical protein